jgi:hypothetical protein
MINCRLSVALKSSYVITRCLADFINSASLTSLNGTDEFDDDDDEEDDVCPVGFAADDEGVEELTIGVEDDEVIDADFTNGLPIIRLTSFSDA